MRSVARPSCVQSQQLESDASAVDDRNAHGVRRGSPALRGAAGIEDLKAMLAGFVQGNVGMTEDHRVRARKPPSQASQAIRSPAPVVHNRETDSGQIEFDRRGQGRAYGLVVGVTVNRSDGSIATQLLQHGQGREIASMNDEVRLSQSLNARSGQLAAPPRKMRVGDDGEDHRADGTPPPSCEP